MNRISNYKKRVPPISLWKITVAALYGALSAIIISIFSGTDNIWIIICAVISASLFITDLFIIIATCGRYRFSDECIEITYLSFCFKRLYYSSFDIAVISNASYNNGYGYGINGEIPMQYRIKENGIYRNVVYPYISMHKSRYPFAKIESAMSSRDLFRIDNEDMYCLGVCWFDSFKELLSYSDYPIYFLEDAYLRFKDRFDNILNEHEEDLERIYIITDRKINYIVYRNRE